MRRDVTFERAMHFAAELIGIPSLPGEEEGVARRIVDELRALGFDEACIDRAGNVVGRIAGAGDAPAVMLSSHMDVVDAGDPAGWEHDPSGGSIRGGFLHGRGRYPASRCGCRRPPAAFWTPARRSSAVGAAREGRPSSAR